MAEMKFSTLVLAELKRARTKFPRPQATLCESREVLREEFDEFVEASRVGQQYTPVLGDTADDNRTSACKELVQLAVFAVPLR